MAASKKLVRYVVVVCANRPSRSFSVSGVAADWSCFVGEDKGETIERGLKARAAWGTRDYELWVGTLTERVIVPSNFKLVAI